MPFKLLPRIDGSIACGFCGAGATSDLEMDRHIGVGFGTAGYGVDGEELWAEQDQEFDDLPTVADVERLANRDPNRDWRIWFHAPLYSAEYQRQGEGVWILVKKGDGFA